MPPPPDPNGPRKRRSMDLIPERMDGPGLAKSSTMRAIDGPNQRGDWGKSIFFARLNNGRGLSSYAYTHTFRP